MARKGLNLLPVNLTHHPKLVWTIDRDWPKPADNSFFEQYRARTAASSASPSIAPARPTHSPAPATVDRPLPADQTTAVSRSAEDRADRFQASLGKAGGSTTDVPISNPDDVLRYLTDTSRRQEVESSRLHDGPLNIRFLTQEANGATNSKQDAAPDALEAFCDVVVVDAHLGVAENGAVWITPADTDRATLFLAQHVIVRLRRSTLVETMHEALDHVGPAWPAFGVWMAGPSKTADVEQSLVIGAHGPRSFVVALLDA